MKKTLNIFSIVICSILALYGLTILIRKLLLKSDESRKSKKDLGLQFYIEPFTGFAQQERKPDDRFAKGNCPGRPATTCDWEKEVMNCNCPDKKCYCVRK